MFKFAVLILLIVAVLLPTASAEASTDAQTCVLTTHNVGRVYDRVTKTSRVQTLADVAKAHNTSPSRIRSLNPDTVFSPLMVGQRLNVWDCDAPLPDPTPRPRTTPLPGFRCLIGICSR